MKRNTIKSLNANKLSASSHSAGSRLVRFSVSMPQETVFSLDRMVSTRGFPSRSQCLTQLVRDSVLENESTRSEVVMMGVITFIYEHGRRDLQNRLTDLQHGYLQEIVTIQLVHLEGGHSLQVLLVQGPVQKLTELKDQILSLKGVRQGTLQLNSTLLPPLHKT